MAQAEYVQVPGLSAISLINFPAEFVNAAGLGVVSATRATSNDFRVTGLEVVSLVKGKTYNPKLRRFTYTLDAHDFYVLRLGDDKTLVFDLYTGQWSSYSSGVSETWKANAGLNWYGAGSIPSVYGSNIIVGDDTYGSLYVLDPEYGVDDNYSGETQSTFDRVATGQIPVRGRDAFPVYSVYLTSALGAPSITPNSVTLEYSDDQGHSWLVADEPQEMGLGDYAKEFSWRSLGQARAPGRLFRITDNGAFSRIDSLDVNNESE